MLKAVNGGPEGKVGHFNGHDGIFNTIRETLGSTPSLFLNTYLKTEGKSIPITIYLRNLSGLSS